MAGLHGYCCRTRSGRCSCVCSGSYIVSTAIQADCYAKCLLCGWDTPGNMRQYWMIGTIFPNRIGKWAGCGLLNRSPFLIRIFSITITVTMLFAEYHYWGIFLNNSYVCLFSALNSSVSWIPPKMKDEGKLRLYSLRLWQLGCVWIANAVPIDRSIALLIRALFDWIPYRVSHW